jgi:hypothetical protein
MTDDVIVGAWQGGHPAGYVALINGSFVLQLRTAGKFESFPISRFATESDARREVEARRVYLSNLYGLTKNLYRRVISRSTGEEWFEVALTKGQIMLCDIGHLPLLERYIWHVNKSRAKKLKYYAIAQVGDKKKYFHTIATTYSMVDHIDSNGLNNRTHNMRWATLSINGRNRRLVMENASGYIGVITCRRHGVVVGYKARWPGTDRRDQSKYFSVNKFGVDEAFRLACVLRNEHSKQLNITTELVELTNDIVRDLPQAHAEIQKPYFCPFDCGFRTAHKRNLPGHINRKHGQ